MFSIQTIWISNNMNEGSKLLQEVVRYIFRSHTVKESVTLLWSTTAVKESVLHKSRWNRCDIMLTVVFVRSKVNQIKSFRHSQLFEHLTIPQKDTFRNIAGYNLVSQHFMWRKNRIKSKLRMTVLNVSVDQWYVNTLQDY